MNAYLTWIASKILKIVPFESVVFLLGYTIRVIVDLPIFGEVAIEV